MKIPDIVKELREEEKLGRLSTKQALAQTRFGLKTGSTIAHSAEEKRPFSNNIRLTHITECETRKEEMRIKDSAIESSINAIAITDLDGNISYVNQSFLEMWRYGNKQEVLGQPAVKFWQMKGQYVEIMDTLMEKGGWVGELVAERRDGSVFDVQLSSTMVKDEGGKPLCMMASFVDITEQKRAKEALKELNRTLEGKVKERTVQVEKLLKQKDEFIGQLGHDIKTPLTPLITLLPIIKKK